MPAARADLLLKALKGAGERLTPARRAIVDALASATEHLTADDLVRDVRERHPGVHRSTVYRNLEALERVGAVEHVHLGHGRSVFHLTDDLHQHLVCEICGSVEEAPPELLAGVARRLRRERGFTMRPYHFSVLGRCQACTGAPSPPTGP